LIAFTPELVGLVAVFSNEFDVIGIHDFYRLNVLVSLGLRLFCTHYKDWWAYNGYKGGSNPLAVRNKRIHTSVNAG
jgi:hypothetical protein